MLDTAANHVDSHNLVDTESLQIEEADEKHKQAEDEGSVVASADALVHNCAVVIEVCHTGVAVLAMGG